MLQVDFEFNASDDGFAPFDEELSELLPVVGFVGLGFAHQPQVHP